MKAIKYGISFALHNRWLTSLVINEFLEIPVTNTLIYSGEVGGQKKMKNTSDYEIKHI